ncbi:MAG: OmpH family outer membrane protein [Proteobacteria bacterium]|nr:MAG: OmpH family outer membrane protein [Pseudomonadota bacterium]
MNKLLVIASVFVATATTSVSAHAAAAPAAAPAAASRIALINMQEAIRGTADGKKAESTLRKEMEDLQKKMQAEGKKIQDSMEALRKQGMVMDEKTRREKEEGIQKQIVALREEEQKNTQKFQERDQQVSQPIIKKLRDIVATIAKEKNFTLVMDGGSVIYAQAGDDITAEVIKRYDAKK